MKQSQVYQLQRFLYLSRKQIPAEAQTGGFTLLESLVVLILIALLMAIAAPSWLGWLDTRRITAVQNEVYSAMRLTQQKAAQTSLTQQFSLRDAGGRLEWAIHSAATDPKNYSLWSPLSPNVQFDTSNTTLQLKQGVYYARFDYQGDVPGVTYLGRVTFIGRNNSSSKRCVVVSTLIGAMRKGEGHSTPDSSGKYCY